MLIIDINEERCTGCYLCVLACPVECFDFDENRKKAVAQRENSCLVCNNCYEQCAPQAIQIIIGQQNHGQIRARSEAE